MQFKVIPSEVKLVLAEERERQRIARGLHDDVGQILVLAQGRIDLLAAGETSPKRVQELDDLRALIMTALTGTRTLTFDLASPALYELGLESALRFLGERTHERHGILVHFESETNVQCTPSHEVLVILHRCIRELLRNVVDHARATKVRIHLAMRPKNIEITVSDNGIGFDPTNWEAAFTMGGKYGLYSIRQQIHYLSGRMTITTSPGNGMRTVLSVPIQPRKTSSDEYKESAKDPL